MQNFLHLFSYEFVQNAYLTGTIVALISAVMGYFVVLRAQTFASEALADIGFAGAAGAAILGVGSLIGMFFLTILAALGMGALGDRLRGRDVEIGMVLSFALGLGVLFLTLYTQSGSHATQGVNVLFGSILSVTRGDLFITFFSSIAALLLIGLLFRPLLFASIDPEVAQTRGVPVRWLSTIFLVLLAITTAEAVIAVGVLLVLALLIAPAASALHLTRRPLTSLLLAGGLSLLVAWGGLTLAFIGPGSRLPVGFFVATLATLLYLSSLLLRRLRVPSHHRTPSPPCRGCKTQQ
ncbi:MAG TPA: metal ABC transporter permease [Ktedonobacteraceae bacterium]|nr:metal ABC transporter permease [Ktedonobacteraceae bacterium]